MIPPPPLPAPAALAIALAALAASPVAFGLGLTLPELGAPLLMVLVGTIAWALAQGFGAAPRAANDNAVAAPVRTAPLSAAAGD